MTYMIYYFCFPPLTTPTFPNSLFQNDKGIIKKFELLPVHIELKLI